MRYRCLPALQRRHPRFTGRAGVGGAAGDAAEAQSLEFGTGSGLYSKTNSSVLAGNSTGFFRAVMFYIPSGYSASGATEVLWTNRENGVTEGWTLRVDGSGNVDGYVADTFPTFIFTGNYAIQASDEDQFHIAYLVADGDAQELRLYFDKFNQGAGGTWSSYNDPSTSAALEIGGLTGFGSADDFEILACWGSDSYVPSHLDIVNHFDACVNAGKPVATGWTGEVWFNADSAITDGSSDSTWQDEDANETLTKSGTVNVNDYDVTLDEAETYLEKVLATESDNLIAYWPLYETSGTTADNAEGTSAIDGSYSGVTLHSSTFSNNDPVGLWDASNDYANMYTSALDTAFNGAEGTLALWIKVSGSGVWTDGNNRRFVTFAENGSNYIILQRSSSNNAISLFYNAGGTAQQVDETGLSTTDWFHLAVTWSAAADEFKAYMDGSQIGTTKTGLGTYVGSLSSTVTVLGADDTTPLSTRVWDGYLAHCAVWDTPLSASQIADLATVP